MENIKDWGLAIGLGIWMLRELLQMYKQSRAEQREDLSHHREQLSKIEENSADTNTRVAEMGKTLAGVTAWQSGVGQQITELKQRQSRTAFEVTQIRDGLNKTRHDLGMAPISQTPAEGIRVYSGGGTGGHVVALKNKKDD